MHFIEVDSWSNLDLPATLEEDQVEYIITLSLGLQELNKVKQSIGLVICLPNVGWCDYCLLPCIAERFFPCLPIGKTGGGQSSCETKVQ
jgi:hypothetical protein